MEQGFIDILQKLIEEQGKEVLLNAANRKGFLADYTKNEFKKESRFLLQALNVGVQREIDASQELPICKKQQIRLLHEDHGMDENIAADVVDTLSFVLRGDTTKTEVQGRDNVPDNKTIQDQVAEEERLKKIERERQAAGVEQEKGEAEERERLAKEKAEREARAAEAQADQVARWRAKGRCPYCGGKLSLFTRKCETCERAERLAELRNMSLNDIYGNYGNTERAAKARVAGEEWRAQGLCSYCGGKLAIFTRKCKNCGRQMSY